MSDGTILSARDVVVSYGAIQAVRGCSLSVGRNEAVAVIGANGAGKTSLLRALSGMVPLQSGEIAYRGRSIATWPAHSLARDGMLHIPEGRGVLGQLSVIENMRLAYDVRPSARSFEEASEEVFAHFPRLSERRRQRAGQMSGGEQQMLALSRVIINPPEILLVDEPSLGLSPVMVKEAFRVLDLFKQRGVAILLVEQNIRLALRFAHRGYVLRQGRFVLEGDCATLLANPEVQRHYLGVSAEVGAP